MLEQIAGLVKQYGQEVIVSNSSIPNENNSAILAEATSTITGGMQNMLAGGGLQDIISMFTGGNIAGGGSSRGGIGGLLKNPMVLMMVGHLISKLMSKFNMSQAQASQVSNALIPNVLSDLVTRTNSNAPDNDDFDLNDLVGSLTGGNNTAGNLDLQGLLNQFTGGNNNPEGFDLQDIISRVTDGAQQKQEQQARSGGSIADLINGFFK